MSKIAFMSAPSQDTTASLQLFERLRARLFGIAYRMLGTRVDAEDVLQDVYLRWHGAATESLRCAEAWLVTVTTRLCIDRLRSARVEREAYTGPWLPEPLVEEGATPEREAELAGDISIAFLTVLERLAPEERAAFLWREVFDMDYDDIATMLDKNATACRQLVHRARQRVREQRPRFTVARDAHVELLNRFAGAIRTGDRQQLRDLFAADVKLTADGGGKVLSALRVLHGTERLVRLYQALARRWPQVCFEFRVALVNGEPGLLRYADGELDAVFTLVTDGERIHEIYSIRNPDKLRAITL